MTGTFIISLDCEGKWGMADHLQPYHHRLLTDRALANVYDQLVGMLARYQLPATFGYVMAFTLSEAERLDFAPQLERGSGESDSWLRYHWEDLEAGRSEGWFQPHALDVVKADGRHEIACHSFCHRPMGNQSLTNEEARAELDAARQVAERKGIKLRTFIFPRNEVGNLSALRQAGYVGYREKLVRGGGRLARLAEELNVRPSLQRASQFNDDFVAIPSGYFFNWRFGARRYVPVGVTLARWKSLLNRTAREGTVAHLWLHPHNLITGPGTAESLEAVLAHAALLRDAGQIEVRTQADFCDDMRGAGGSRSRAA